MAGGSDSIVSFLIAGGAVLVSAAATVATLWMNSRNVARQLAHESELNRIRQLDNLVMTAVGYFEGGSQKRTIGITSLRAVAESTADWARYRVSIAGLFYAQLLYLFRHGDNRWAAHEIANMESMADWLLLDNVFPSLAPEHKLRLLDALDRYQAEAVDQDVPAKDKLLEKLGTWRAVLSAPDEVR
jgi:hypothetical protein